MKPADFAELFALAAIWGGSFLFTRIVAPTFGPVPLTGLRVAGAALVLLPLLAGARGTTRAMLAHWRPIAVLGIANSAFPFLCFSYAALTLTAGLNAIFNAAAPLFGALIARLWLGQRLTRTRVLGLAIGFAGVFGLAWARASVKSGADAADAALAVSACIVATVSYGFSANYARHALTGVPPLAVAAGSQCAAALALLGPTVALWPDSTPGAAAWVDLALLAVLCTGIAYVMYFRLIARVGPANAITVTFLVPAFAVAWGALFLDERPGAQTLAGCAVILLGTALATGVLPRPRRRAQAAPPLA